MDRKLVPIDKSGRTGGPMPPSDPPQGPLDRAVSSLTRQFRGAVGRDVQRAMAAMDRREKIPVEDYADFTAFRKKLEQVQATIEAGGIKGAMMAWQCAPMVRDVLRQVPR
jgi:hypothetical protein